MSATLIPIDISRMPDLRHLAEEVRTSQKPRPLKVHGEILAMVMPVETKAQDMKKRKKTTKDYEAFRAAAGSWQDVDTDTLLKNMDEDRRRTNTRASVNL